MKILGVNDGHLATAALLVDGQLTACVSEEKFTKVKNQPGLPVESIKFCLQQAGLRYQDLDLVVFGGENAPPVPLYSSADSRRLRILYGTAKLIFVFFESRLQIYLPFLRKVKELFYYLGYQIFKPRVQWSRKRKLSREFGVDLGEKVVFLQHHLCHVYSALFGSGFADRSEAVLVLTADGEGDLLSATVGVFKDGRYQRISQTSMNDSLGSLYYCATVHLSMKPMEHEYKVMGLAPYASPADVEKVYARLKDLLVVDPPSLKFKAKFDTHLLIAYFRDNFYNVRFDHFAGGVQKLAEELLTAWVRACIKKTKISNLVLSGGVFMNVKANQKILELAEVERLFVMPSCGDESNAIGACFWGSFEKFSHIPKPLGSLSLGPSYTNEEIAEVLKDYQKNHSLNYEYLEEPELKTAELVAQGEVVAVLNGRLEFGARALGNRSIMADASKVGATETINKMIKIRDFWMPFAPVILRERQNDYLVNPKGMPAPYMIITFESTIRAEADLRGALHSYDKTLRPQVIDSATNLYYYHIVKKYEELTGRGGLLNTSFNLHGDPIVNTPQDALRTFLNSGLKYLFLENYLVTKI